MRAFYAVLLSISGTLFAAHPICVRHYAEQKGGSLCERFSDTYTYLSPLKNDLEKPVCARIYSNFYCENSQTYEYVLSITKGRVCVLNDNQPSVVNLCEKVPDFYEYVRDVQEDYLRF